MMGKGLIWALALIIPIAVCLMILYLAFFAALQEKCVKKLQYVISSRGSHYWNYFKLPTIPSLSYLFLTTHLVQDKDEHARVGKKLTEGHHSGNEGLTTKLMEAAEESLEKTKVMMEDTAKSAAEVAGEAVHKTADRVKETLSKPTLASHSHDEL